MDETLIVTLELFGKIRNGDKVNITENNINIEHPTWISSIKRWYSDDNRNKTLEFLQNLVQKSSNQFKQLEEKKICNDRLIRSTYNAIIGIRCLTFTYSDDLLFVTSIENIIQQFEILIDDHKN